MVNKIKKLVTNSFVLKWFAILLGFVTLLVLSFMIYTRVQSTNLMQTEFTSYSDLQTERIAAHLDDCFQSYNRVGALLSLNEKANIYLFRENATDVFPDIYTEIHSQLIAYKQGFPAIDSIYLLPASCNEIITSDYLEPIPLSSLEDSNWFSYVDTVEGKDYIYRKKYDRYPYLATLLIPVRQSGQEALIVLNINMYNISILEGKNSNSFQNIYIVSDQGEILYRTFQSAMPESLSAVEELSHFNGSLEKQSLFVDSESQYVFVQQHSSKYPWYYITITTPQAFNVQSFDFFASLKTFLPWLSVLAVVIIVFLVLMLTHPLRTISEFLDAPLTQVPDDISEPEVQEIIRHFINYVHTNESLSNELNHQLELQNNATYCALQAQINPHFLFNTLNMIRNKEIECLGFDHEVPDMTLTLSRLLQYAVSSTELVSLNTEFHYMDLYLKILNQRYKNKLHFDIRKSANVSDILIPKMILQPLVENAVFHGCSPNLNDSSTVVIDAHKQNNQCIITISDNGIGIIPDTLKELRNSIKNITSIPSDSIGLHNVAFRMYLTYGEDFDIDIESHVGEGTCITLSFPA